MKHILIITVLMGMLVSYAYATSSPVVNITNVTQRTELSRKVDIYYNISHTMPVTVALQVSSDNGVTWNLPCTLVTGDIGANISPGNGKHIVWDVLAEHPDVIYENVRFKVIADDGQSPPPPANFVFVQGGTFNNGTSDVTISSFYIDKYEVTQASYQAVMGTNPSSFGGNPNRPVERVSWFNAIEYCNRRSLQEGLTPCYSYSTYGTNPDGWPSGWNTSNSNHTNVNCNWSANGYRLPTEMEWMFAAKGGNQSQGYTYSGSNTIGNVAWYSSNSSSRTWDVGLKDPNELGTFDMSGNVWEWVWDIRASLPNGNQTNPTGPVSGSVRVARGGGWYGSAGYCTVSSRHSSSAALTRNYIGFRLIRVSL
ncbi:MAG: SUMF1/EgtB/PvdO family nonheme iron enzyme [Candidatus Cloacimonetes bacterium]|nr:SUMF1/EgtB/PvdO family nonheme iron enzyme [Candidatus Cloacimonadota bacterium]